MGNLFGVRRRAPVVTAQDRTILQLKQQRDKIKIYQRRTESELARNTELALKLYQSGLKDRAIIVLKRKKMMEDILTRTDKQLETLEQLVSDIEYTQIEVSVVEGLKVGTEALKQLNSLMNVDDIQQMMEDNAEAAEKQREISAILQQSSERYDEQDLLKELEGYQKEQQPQMEEPKKEEAKVDKIEEEEKAAAKVDNLPNVPESVEVADKQPEAEQQAGELAAKADQEADEEQETSRPKERRKMLAESS